jgi:serine/threonine protein kinase
MGVVYRAMDSVLNRAVAVKVMSDAIARQAELRDRFLREAQAAGSLQHPNVITIYDFGEVEGHLFIAMEFVDGIDLEKLLVAAHFIADTLDRPLATKVGQAGGWDAGEVAAAAER